ncbi:ABC transporter permease [bacterium]|nr:ABC transporter permease [bacterium]
MTDKFRKSIEMDGVFDCAFRELFRRKSRTVSSIFGYFLATGVLIVIVHVLLFSKRAENEVLTRTGTHFVAFSPSCREGLFLNSEEIKERLDGKVPPSCQEQFNGCTSCRKKAIDMKNEAFISDTVVTRLLSRNCVELVKSNPTIKDASPYLLFRFKDPMDGHFFSLGGFDPANTTSVYTTVCSPKHVVSGAFLKPRQSGFALLEEAYAVQINAKVSDNIIISGFPFTISGIVRPGNRPGKADVYVSLKDAEMVINPRIRAPLLQEVNVILVEAASSSNVADAIAEVKKCVPGGLVTSFSCSKPASAAFGINEKSLWALIFFIALSAVAFSLKTQMTSVIERRHDIGILKTLGWTNEIVVSQIILESLIQAIAGGTLGSIGAISFIFVVPLKQLSGIDTTLDLSFSPTVFSIGLFLTMAGGIIAGIFPALSAAKTNPADALRIL